MATYAEKLAMRAVDVRDKINASPSIPADLKQEILELLTDFDDEVTSLWATYLDV